MRRDANAAAHDDAVHYRDIGLWEGSYTRIQLIFLAPKRLERIALGARQIVKRANIAARAKPALALSRHQNGVDARVQSKLVQRAREYSHHAEGQAVERLRAVQADRPQMTDTRYEQIGFTHVAATLPICPARR